MAFHFLRSHLTHFFRSLGSGVKENFKAQIATQRSGIHNKVFINFMLRQRAVLWNGGKFNDSGGRGVSKLRLFILFRSRALLCKTKEEKVFRVLFSTVSYLIICRHVANREKLCEMAFSFPSQLFDVSLLSKQEKEMKQNNRRISSLGSTFSYFLYECFLGFSE